MWCKTYGLHYTIRVCHINNLFKNQYVLPHTITTKKTLFHKHFFFKSQSLDPYSFLPPKKQFHKHFFKSQSLDPYFFLSPPNLQPARDTEDVGQISSFAYHQLMLSSTLVVVCFHQPSSLSLSVMVWITQTLKLLSQPPSTISFYLAKDWRESVN